MPSTIKDVARKAGVSSATVSRVLSGKPHVRELLIENVLRAASELNFHPNRVARSLRIQKSSIIGLIISDIQNPFFTAIVRAVEDSASRNGFAVFLCNSDENIEKEAVYIDLLQAEKVAGVLMTPTREQGNPCLSLQENGIPVVVFDRRLVDQPVDTVVTDNYKGAYQGVEHLIRQGHTHIAVVAASWEKTTGRERLSGYRQALEDNQLAYDDKLVFTGLPNRETGRISARKIIESSLKPTAIFCGNNLLTAGVLSYLKETGRSMPHDYALVSFDDMDWYSITSPTITAIQQPIYDLGRTAADLLFERINGCDAPVKEIIMDTQLVIRQSSIFPEG